MTKVAMKMSCDPQQYNYIIKRCGCVVARISYKDHVRHKNHATNMKYCVNNVNCPYS